MREDFKVISVRGSGKDWEDFKILCKLMESDASKEIRKTIKEALILHEDLLLDYKERQRLQNEK